MAKRAANHWTARLTRRNPLGSTSTGTTSCSLSNNKCCVEEFREELMKKSQRKEVKREEAAPTFPSDETAAGREGAGTPTRD